jgi:hypothetical protein
MGAVRVGTSMAARPLALRSLLLLLFTAALSVSTAVAAPACPKWVNDYAAWHGSTRSTVPEVRNVRPRSAIPARSLRNVQPAVPRLVHHCGSADEVGGLGDHMRGVLFAFRLAATHRRLLLVDWTGRFNLTGMLEPGSLDWRAPQDWGRRNRVYLRDNGRTDDDMLAVRRQLASALANRGSDVVLCTAVSATASFTELPGLRHADLTALRCIWRLLFKPSPQVTSRANEMLAQMLGGDGGAPDYKPPPYVGAHLRLGGLAGESQMVRYAGCEHLVQFAMQSCARNLAVKLGGKAGPSPVVLITDNSVLRHAVASGALAGLTGPKTFAQHMRFADSSNFTDVYAELLLLARADCLVTSRSGFSDIALWWSTTNCREKASACLTAHMEKLGADYAGKCDMVGGAASFEVPA